MAAPQTQMLTANRLRDGAVVYWSDGNWLETFDDGDVFEEKQAAQAALASTAAFVTARIVVNPYLFSVRIENGIRRAVEEREIVRSRGPSIFRARPDLPPVPLSAEQPPHQGDVKEGFDVSL